MNTWTLSTPNMRGAIIMGPRGPIAECTVCGQAALIVEEHNLLAARVARLESLLARTLPYLPIAARTRHDPDTGERAALNAEIRAALADES